MADDNDRPDKPTPDSPGVVVPPGEAGTPPPAAIPDAGEAAGADAEKAAMVEQAWRRSKNRLVRKRQLHLQLRRPPRPASLKLPSRKKKKVPSRLMLPATNWSRV